MRKTLVAASLFVLALSALAQDSNFPQASLDREINISRASGTGATHGAMQNQAPPSYCKPCLFYAGDFDSNASDANGLANEKDILISTGAATYVPFTVPAGQTWNVTGLFTLNFMTSTYLYPQTAPYEIRRDIPKSGGNGGHLVCHGKGTATVKDPAICEDFGFQCYDVIVSNIKGCRLRAGKYWESVVPYCTNQNACNSWRAFITNDDGSMAHRYGPLEPANDSFFNSAYYGAVWEPSTEQQSSKRFSAGVEGTKKKN
jgi:hypothetical protein